MSSIVIVDLGTGNLHSVGKALEHVCAEAGNGARVHVSAQPRAIADADRLVLPGQGALGAWIERLNASPALRDAVYARLHPDATPDSTSDSTPDSTKGPVLGICLGLQALYARSEENGGLDGLGLLRGTVRHFAGAQCNERNERDHDRRRKIPHMGWNRVRHTRAHPLWRGIADQQRFYFVHSYFVDSEARDEVVGECEYGHVFTAAAARDNLFATQFHPEKSHRAGLQLLRNFIAWDGAR
ncbi:MAG: imidazole glycerol phosphate synthase subunit HisH [bacterium]